jgi:serine/threonine protein phosphatase PrpC
MIQACGATDPGCVRTNNEDYYLVLPDLGLYLVADGMGGAQAGEHASKLAADTVREAVARSNGTVGNDTLVAAFVEANQKVMEAAAADPRMEGMGTTLVAVLQSGGDLLIASVGDSRVYLFDKDKLSSITEDQSWVNEVGRRLGIEESSLKSHPMRHVLTMAIGVSDQLRVHTYTLKPVAGTQLLLCSDGLHGVAPELEVAGVLGSAEGLEAKCQKLIESARTHGGPDNITAVILKAT